MDGLNIELATAWDQIEVYTTAVNACISPSHWNWEAAKESWEQDVPQPKYVLLDYQGCKGYMRFLPVAGFLWSDFYKMATPSVTLTVEESYQQHKVIVDIWLATVRFLGQPCLVGHNSYGGRDLKWIGSRLPYKRVNHQPINGTTMWLLFPEDIGGITKDLGPSTAPPIIDC